jgi:hypothetical protein
MTAFPANGGREEDVLVAIVGSAEYAARARGETA